MPGSAPAIDSDASFTLDADLLAERRAANAHRVHTVQLPAVRAGGFAILCVIAILQDVRLGAPLWQPQLLLVLALNVGYAALSWLVLRRWYGRTGRFDLGLFFLHLDILVWLPNLRHLEQAQPVLRLPAADPRRRPGRLRLSPRALLRPRHRRHLPALLVVGVAATRRPALERSPDDRRGDVPARHLPRLHRPGVGAPARPRAPGDAIGARAGRQPRAEEARARGPVARARGGQPQGGAGERRQGAVPGDDQPRDPHADERRARHDRAAARDAARRAPAPSRRNGAPLGDGAAGADRRRARPVAHRSQQAHAPVDQLRPARPRHRSGRPDGDDRARQAADAHLHHLAGVAGAGRRRSDAPAPGARQPAAQRGQVHRARRHRARRDRPRRRRRRGAAAVRGARYRHRPRRGPVRLGLRRLHPGRRFEHAAPWRHRTRPGDRQGDRRADGRAGRRRQPARGGLDVLVRSQPQEEIARQASSSRPRRRARSCCRRISCWPRTTR